MSHDSAKGAPRGLSSWAGRLLLASLPAMGMGCGERSAAVADGGDGSDGGGDAAGVVGLCPGDPVERTRPDDWGVATHCPGADPDYDFLFDETVVRRLDIEIAPDLFASMEANLEDLYGAPGPPSREDPIWVPVTARYEGLVWREVGMRYKGNSSLRSAYQQGVRKLAFRLQFDRYEGEHPELLDQRFYGFRKMTFSNAFKDRSLIRDKLAADVFRAAGVPAARGAFVRVYVDSGDGPVFFGLYTMVEDPSNRMLDTQFTDDSGNLYKPEGGPNGLDQAARWSTTAADLIRGAFDKETNEEVADWSDVMAAIGALLADRTDAAAWRAGLEATFDVPAFLRCLAVSTAMVNWDSYGAMPHNYYVYADPGRDGRLVWFPWDLNEAMLPPVPNATHMSAVMLDGVGTDWPLIRFLLDDPVYRETYEAELLAAIDGAYALATVQARTQAMHDLVAPYVVGPESVEAAPYTFLGAPQAFADSLTVGEDALLPWVEARRAAVRQALGL